MDIAQTIALTMGVAWASGINLYAAILMLGARWVDSRDAASLALATLDRPALALK